MELYKLHLKHHQNLDQFKSRTAASQIPKKRSMSSMTNFVKKCSICQEHRRDPSKAKISGLRSDVFGDLTFADHGELPIPSKSVKLMFFTLYDGAANLVQDKEEPT